MKPDKEYGTHARVAIDIDISIALNFIFVLKRIEWCEWRIIS